MAGASEAVRPFHVEAYPTLDLRAARRQVRDGRSVVLWRDQTGALVGIARVEIDADETMQVETRLRGLPHLMYGLSIEEIACNIVTRDEGQVDVLSLCKSCNEVRRRLILLDGKWLCRKCQHIGYRSTAISHSVRDSERLTHLDALLWRGRPRHMSRVAFGKLAEERRELRYLLDGQRALPPPHLRYVLTSDWIAEPPALRRESGKAYVLADVHDEASSPKADILEMTGGPLFAGLPLAQAVEKAVATEIGPAYRLQAQRSSRVSPLQVRRAFGQVEVGTLPVLGDALVAGDLGGAPLMEAVMTIPFDGDPRLLNFGLPGPVTRRRPLGLVEGKRLLLTARFTPANAAFVPALLQGELALVQWHLEQQGEAMAEVLANLPNTIKRLVAAQWPHLH